MVAGPVLNLSFLMDEVMEDVKPLFWDAVLDSPIPLKVFLIMHFAVLRLHASQQLAPWWKGCCAFLEHLQRCGFRLDHGSAALAWLKHLCFTFVIRAKCCP